MRLNRTRRPTSWLAFVLTFVLVTVGVVTGQWATGGTGAAAQTTSGIQTEAEQFHFAGGWSLVQDAAATNGTAVVLKNGGLYSTASLPTGTYLMTARVRSAGARLWLGTGEGRIATAMVAGGWRTVSAPVRLSGTTLWGAMPIGRTDSGPNEPLYVDWMSLQPTTAGYTTIENKILDPSGRRITPRGVNRNGFEFKPATSYWMSDNDYQAMYLWGSTVVRLPLSQQYWLSSSCDYDPTYATRVDEAIQSITKRGMIALVDLHTTAVGKACGTPRLSPMADDYSLEFWRQVATRYKSNPLVAFELFNEPHYVSLDVWHGGGTIGDWHAVGMQQLYDAVRATGATNLVFVGGMNWAYRIDAALYRPVDGYGIVYASHVYSKDGAGPLPTDIDSVIAPVAARYPVMITEFGSKAGTATFNANVIAWAEKHSVGWAAWMWYQEPAEFALLKSFWSYAPSAAGQPVRDALWKARGWTTWGK